MGVACSAVPTTTMNEKDETSYSRQLQLRACYAIPGSIGNPIQRLASYLYRYRISRGAATKVVAKPERFQIE